MKSLAIFCAAVSLCVSGVAPAKETVIRLWPIERIGGEENRLKFDKIKKKKVHL